MKYRVFLFSDDPQTDEPRGEYDQLDQARDYADWMETIDGREVVVLNESGMIVYKVYTQIADS